MPYLGKPLHGSPASLDLCTTEIIFFFPQYFQLSEALQATLRQFAALLLEIREAYNWQSSW